MGRPLAIDTSSLTTEELAAELEALICTPRELRDFIVSELEGANRDTAVQVLKQAYDVALGLEDKSE